VGLVPYTDLAFIKIYTDNLQRYLDEGSIGSKVSLGILRRGLKEHVDVIPVELTE